MTSTPHTPTPPRHEVVGETGSTNADLLRYAADPALAARWPHGSSLRARRQSQGRGRAGREWVTPADADDALTASVLLRPRVPAERLADVTRLVSLAALRAVNRLGEEHCGARGFAACGLKWPNDLVLDVGGSDVPGWGRLRKVGGVLVQGVPAAPAQRGQRPAVVAGVGINLRQDADALPVPWATSLKLAGHPAVQDGRLPLTSLLWRTVLDELLGQLVPAWEAAAGDLAALPGVLEELRAAMTTLGRSVEVTPAGGGCAWQGRAIDMDPAGGLLVEGEDGTVRQVAAGDIAHLRLTNCDAGNTPQL